ncbi:MAG: DoxX family protein [Chlamydiales bacterium]
MLSNPFLYWVDKIYGFFIKIGSNLQSLFLLYMRITWGHQLFLAGLHKLNDIPGTVLFFTKLGIPSPLFHAYEVGILETVGALSIFFGLASRLFSIPVIFVMLTALSTAHGETLGNFKFLSEPYLLVIQEPYPVLVTALMVLMFGPGRISIDAWLKRWVSHQPKY